MTQREMLQLDSLIQKVAKLEQHQVAQNGDIHETRSIVQKMWQSWPCLMLREDCAANREELISKRKNATNTVLLRIKDFILILAAVAGFLKLVWWFWSVGVWL